MKKFLFIAFIILLSPLLNAENMRDRIGKLSGEMQIKNVSKKIALLIGIDQFEDSKWPTLKFPRQDVDRMSGVLADYEKIILVGKERTKRSDILYAINELSKINSNVDDTIIVYISSHGTLGYKSPGDLRRYVVASDTKKDMVEQTGLLVDDLYKVFDTCKSRKKVLIFAFCHSGKGKSYLNDDLSKMVSKLKSGFFVKPIEEVSKATIVISASSWGEVAIEDDKLGGDVYTYYFAEGIEKGDLNQDGAVTITEAHEYAREKVYYYTNGMQKPSIETFIEGADPIILRGSINRAGKPLIFGYGESSSNLKLLVNGRPKGVFPSTIVLDEGEFDIELLTASGKRLVSQRLNLKSGEAIEVSRLIPPPRYYGVEFSINYVNYFNDILKSELLPPGLKGGLSFYVRRLLFSNNISGIGLSYYNGNDHILYKNMSIPYNTNLFESSLYTGIYLDIYPDISLSLLVKSGIGYVNRDITFDVPEEYKYESHQNCSSYFAGLPVQLNYTIFHHLNLGIDFEPRMDVMVVDNKTNQYFSISSGISIGLEY